MPKTKATPATGPVHLYPDPYHFVDGEPHVERDVTEEEAERLLAYQPAAYHLDRPGSGPLTPAEEPDPPAPDEAAATTAQEG